MRSLRNRFVFPFCVAGLLVALALIVRSPEPVRAALTSAIIGPTFGYMIGQPAINIAGAAATSAPQDTSGVTTAHIQMAFGSVSGSYGTCSCQAKTSFDGTNFLTLGSAASITATTSTINAWDIYGQVGVTTGVTVTTPSSSAASGFGAWTEYYFSCSGSYGTSAPATINVIYK